MSSKVHDGGAERFLRGMGKRVKKEGEDVGGKNMGRDACWMRVRMRGWKCKTEELKGDIMFYRPSL